jgi:hypothetical protein
LQELGADTKQTEKHTAAHRADAEAADGSGSENLRIFRKAIIEGCGGGAANIDMLHSVFETV